MRYIKIKNIDTDVREWGGKIFNPNEELTLQSSEELRLFQQCTVLFSELEYAEIYNDDGVCDNIDAWAHIQGSTNNTEISKSPPFASKTLPDGRKLYKRKHGFSITVPANNSYEGKFNIPYNYAKITGAEIVGCVKGDRIDFKAYDTPTGSLSTVPNAMLNQFGFEVYLPDGFYSDHCCYDADLIKDMKMGVTYYNSTDAEVTIYVNLTLHEVKE